VNVVSGTSTPPEITILNPEDRSVFSTSAEITFNGQALDLEDGDISSQIVWSSDLAGLLGVGASIVTSGLENGVHTITAEITDSDGLSSSASILIAVRGNSAPIPIQFSGENTSGTSGQWQKFIGRVGDRDGYADIAEIWMLLERNPGEPESLLVKFLLEPNEIYLYDIAGGDWIGPCTPGDPEILSNGVVDIDCQLSTMMYAGGQAVIQRLVARWDLTLSEPIIFTMSLRAIDHHGNDSGYTQFGSWTLLPN
jgi:hypothetical protein